MCVCVCVCVPRSTVPHVSYTAIRTGERTAAAAGGFVPTVSSNPARTRRKLGTTIRGPTWQLESCNLAGKAKKASRKVATVGAPAGLADRQTVRPAGLQSLTGRLQHGTDSKRDRKRKRAVYLGLELCAVGAGTGADRSFAVQHTHTHKKKREHGGSEDRWSSQNQKPEPQYPRAGDGDRQAGPRTLSPEVCMSLTDPRRSQMIPTKLLQTAPDCSSHVLQCPLFPIVAPLRA